MIHDMRKWLSEKLRWLVADIRILICIVIFVGAGLIYLIVSRAATVAISLEAENGTLSNGALAVNDSTASGGRMVRFGAAPASTPTPTPTPTSPPTGSSACLTRSTIVRLSGAQSAYTGSGLSDNAGLDARGATWTDAGNYPFVLKGASGKTNICMYGGKISTTKPNSTPWSTWHDNYAMIIEVPKFTTEGIRIHNEGDGTAFSNSVSDWTVRGAHISFIHDDCVENDYMSNGLVEDSLFDGCYVAFSARGHSGQSTKPNGLGKTMTFNNVLAYVKPMPTVYKGSVPGNGPIFKWSDIDGSEGYGTKIVMNNTIIRVDKVPNHGDLSVPNYKDPSTGATKSYMTSCSNNTIVWTGGGTFPGNVPSCFRITSDVSVWNNAVTAWKAAHPLNAL